VLLYPQNKDGVNPEGIMFFVLCSRCVTHPKAGTYGFNLFIFKRAGDAIIEHQRSQPSVSVTDALYSVATFREEFAGVALPGVVLSDQDVKVILRYLQRDKQLIVTEKEVCIST